MAIIYLHGGSPGRDWRLYQSLVEIGQRDVIVLSIGFAVDNPKIRTYAANELQALLRFVNPHLNIDVENAKEPILWLTNQIQAANVFFVHGGNGDLLNTLLSPIKNVLAEKLKDEKVKWFGNSAGANTLSNLYYSNDNKKIDQGLGILPISTFCHYESRKWRELDKLTGESIFPVIPLMDDEWISLDSVALKKKYEEE